MRAVADDSALREVELRELAARRDARLGEAVAEVDATVRWEIQQCAATSLFDIPVLTSCATCRRGGRVTTAVLRDATHWDEVVAALGFEHLRRHALRHTGLTWTADASGPVHVLRKIAGHGSLTTTQRYLHPDAASISAAATRSRRSCGLRGPQVVPS